MRTGRAYLHLGSETYSEAGYVEVDRLFSALSTKSLADGAFLIASCASRSLFGCPRRPDMFHGEVADSRQPDLVGRGGERPHQPRTAFGSGEDSHHWVRRLISWFKRSSMFVLFICLMCLCASGSR